MIIMEFHVFAISMILWLHDMLETIDIPKGILMFRGGRTQACGKSHISRIFMKMQGVLEILHFSHKNMEFHGFSAFWGARTLQKHQNSLGNINGFHHGGGRASIL